MKLIVDDKIPFIKGEVEKVADEVLYLPGAEINASDVHDADALIVRTRTLCNRTLLEGSRVQFIATATIGFDHLDTDYLSKAGISWSNCPGCNADSVAQYIHSVLLLLQNERNLQLPHSTLGIIGVGHVGSRVLRVAQSLGMKVLCCDAPRTDQGEQGFIGFDEIVEKCDVISFHVPLIREGRYRTIHMADEKFFERLARVPYIINTSRGEVVDNEALLGALNKGRVADAVIDVWENEPDINTALLERVFLGTPHIAGYSADGKANATRMSLEALCLHFGIDNVRFDIQPPALPDHIDKSNPLNLYNPQRDSRALKQHPEQFEYLRGNYPLRREK